MLKSLRFRFTLIFIGLAIGPLILVGAITGQRSFASLEGQSLALQREIAASVGSQVRAFVEGRMSELVLLDKVYGLGVRELDEQRAILSNVLLYQRAYQEVALLNLEGQERIRLSRTNVILGDDLQSRAGNTEYLWPATRGETYFSPVRFDETIREPLITISVHLFDQHSGEVVSVLVADLRFKKIWELLAMIELADKGDAYVVDQAGRIVAHRSPTVVLGGTTIDLPEADGRAEGLSGAEVIVARDILQFGNQELIVLAEQPVSTALELAVNSLRVTVAATSVAFGLAVILVVLTTRQIIRPIETLATSVHAISDGDFSRRVAVPPFQDEIADLARSFNSMARALQEREETLQAQNEALQAEIADRKRAEEALRISEERFALAVRGSNDGLWDWDILNDSLYWSPRLKELLGYAEDELDVDFSTFESHLHPDDRGRTKAAIEAHLKDRGLYDVEQRLRTKSGEYRCFRARGQALWDEDGNPLRMVGSTTDITERKRVEEEIKTKNQFLESLIEQSPLPTFVIDSGGICVMVNKAFLKAYHVPQKEMVLGHNALTEPANVRQGVVKYMKEALGGKIVETPEMEFFSPYGNKRTVTRSRLFPIFDTTNQLTNVVVMHEDVTEHKRVKEALGESHERFLTVVDSIDAHVYAADMETYEILFMNRKMRDDFGGDLVGKICWDVFRGDSKPCSHCTNDKLIDADGNPTGVHIWEGHNPITERWYMNYDRAIKWIDGRLVRLQIATDITERKRAEEALRQYTTQLEALRGMGLELTSQLDLNALLRSVVSWAVELLRGVSGSFYLYRPDLDALELTVSIGIESEPSNQLLLHRGEGLSGKVLETGESLIVDDYQHWEGRATAWEGYSFTAVVAVPVRWGDQFLGVLNVDADSPHAFCPADIELLDLFATQAAIAIRNARLYEVAQQEIAERKQAEDKLKGYSQRLEEMVEERTQELRDAHERLMRREKLAIMGQLAGGVAHELRNPLGTISNATYYLKMVLPDAEETVKEYLDMIIQTVRDSDKIISDLLDFSRTRIPDREKVAVSELVAQVLEQRPPPERVEVIAQIASDLPPVYVDRHQMCQVLGNLVTNAYQSMPEGGDLTISAQAQEGAVALLLADTGVGISEENMAKLFEPLFTTRAKGLGLGLMVVKTLVEGNGGSIEVESEEGKGSTFTVRLPVAGYR